MATRSSQCPAYILGLHNQARGLFPTTATLHRATLLGSHHEYAGRVTLPQPLGPGRYTVQATNSSSHRGSDKSLMGFVRRRRVWRCVTSMQATAFIAVLMLAFTVMVAPLAAEAQQGKAYRIGYVGNSSASLEPRLLGAFRDGLRNLGYVEGQNIRIEYRWAEGRYERFPDFMAELVRLKVDLIVVAGTPATLAAKQATDTIPIVMAVIGDALEAGVVPSLARPGGNVTGLSTVVPELEGKRLELLKQALPKLSRLAVLANPANPFVEVALKHTQRAAEELRVKLQRVDVRQPEEFGNAFSVIANERPDALTVIADRFMLTHRAQIIAFGTKG